MNFRSLTRIFATVVCFWLVLTSEAALRVGAWEPVFKGIELSISTNIPASGGEIVRRQVVYALRVDLSDPDVEFFTTPRITNYSEGLREIAAYTPSDFLARNHLQVVINANYFSEGSYYLPAGTPMDLYGLAVSQGTVVSKTDSRSYAATITFDTNNFPTFIRSNWPAASTEGVYTAVSGNFPVLIDGTNVGTRFDVDPRTVFGLSQDRRYLFLVTIDGRQPGYSDGATLYECGQWLQALGARDGINVDGGGSSTLVFENSIGKPQRINRSSAVADSGRERTVGSHFGMYAKPLRGFINDVVVSPGITTASISFTTTGPTVSEIHYGRTTALGTSGGVSQTEESSHTRELTGLTPETGYYFQIAASSNGVQQLSPLFFFTTTNLTTTNMVFDVTNHWKYSYTPLSSTQWTVVAYNDTNWASGPGLLWVDNRATPNPDVQPRNTQMPGNPNLANDPYVTYYFRTHFSMDELTAGSSLLFHGFIDDGAAFYLNGTEIYRVRLPANASSGTLANGFPCSGNADCIDEFKLPFASLPSLRKGDNVLAVEVHNYNLRSSDITFGLRLYRIDPFQGATPAHLRVAFLNDSIEISWEGEGGTLQSAQNPAGPWTDFDIYSGNRVTIAPAESLRFFRLKR